MQEQSRYAVGIDVGTKNVRCVIGYIDADGDAPKIVGVGTAPNSGMRKGTVTNLAGPAEAIDTALGAAERMSGHQVKTAVLSVNGSHLTSTKADGMITVGTTDNEVTPGDIVRLEDMATTGKIAQNREILEIVAHSYRLDGQDNIKDPIGMTGTRLEIKANVVSGLLPHITNLQKLAEMAKVEVSSVVPAVLASAQAVLTENQRENGVAVLDIGAATTGVAVFEEGDLQYVGVVPKGGVNITNDLAIGLKTDPEVAEKVKLQHAAAIARGEPHKVSIKHEKETLFFDQADVDEIVEARLEEIFELVNKELKKAGRAGQLPSGAVLTGGTANLKGMAEYAKSQLGVAVRIGKPHGFGGVADEIDKPHFAAAVGLMLVDADAATVRPHSSSMSKKSGGFIKSLLSKFKP